jgi:hypothetical protein
MRAKAGILLIMGLLLLVGTVAAADTSTNTTDKDWVIANGIDSSIISVNVSNTNGIKDGVATVKFTVNPLYGTMDPENVIADGSGLAQSIFYVNTKSGTAIITANITYTDTTNIPVSVELPITQNIDHDIPSLPPNFGHPNEGTIASEVPFTIAFTDRWGNRIDNRTGEAHTVLLTVFGPDPNDCYFVVPNVHDISLPLDSNGILSVNVTLTSKPGPNNIVVRPQWTTNMLGRSITALANGIPYSMIQVYDPPGTPPSLPADGNKKFIIKYVLFDQFGNPTSGQNVTFNTGIGDKATNSDGEVWIEYGPSSVIEDTTITATAVNNLTVTKSQPVKFYNQFADDFEVGANPKIMASVDANPNAKGFISAKVIDGNGFPVTNEFVSFVIKPGSVNYPGGPYNVTAPPYLESVNSTTDNFGNAVVVFRPGAFSLNRSDLNYNASATGSCIVSATWSNITKDTVPIVWKNYPYLTVTTSVSPQVVNVNETVDVRVLLNGDGFGFTKKPIDVALVMDRSGSMSGAMGSGTRLSNAKTAAKSFVNQMNNATDRLAVVSYAGYTSGTGTRTDIALTSSFNSVNSAIDALIASGATESREALKQSIELLNASPNPNPKAIQAVVFMTDGNYNWKGNPLGRGTGWPLNASFSFSTNNLEPDDYRYYDGLGGNLTSYTTSECDVYSSTVCDQYSSTNCDVRSTTVCDNYANRCDICAPDYTGPNSNGQCRWMSGVGHDHNYYYPNTKPASCSSKHCNTWHCNLWHCNLWHCDAFKIGYKCTDGESTNQNMANYAISKNIRIYMISFASVLDPQAVSDMQYLSTTTGGFYRYAPDAAALNQIYAEIAGDLKSEAAVNTSMSLDFGNITVSNVQIDGFDVFEYVHDPQTNPPGSTWIQKYNKTSTIIPPYTIDDTSNWITNKSLTFNVGTIKLNETWEANFRFKVLREGNIEIFGPSSTISFTDAQDLISTLTLPNTSVSAQHVATNATEKTIKIENLQPSGPITVSIPMAWTTKYNGNSTVTEKVSYSHNNGPWYLFNLQSGISPGTSAQTASLDVSGFPTGYYRIKVVATSNDAAMVSKISDSIYIVGKGIFITLE